MQGRQWLGQCAAVNYLLGETPEPGRDFHEGRHPYSLRQYRFMTGFMMQKGRIIVCGDVGEAVGDSMYEGTIYVGGEIGSLGADATIEDIGEDELIDIFGTWRVTELKRGSASLKSCPPKSYTTTTPWSGWKRRNLILGPVA